jgi:hypothetical protein
MTGRSPGGAPLATLSEREVTVVLPPWPGSRPAGLRAPRPAGGAEPTSDVVSRYLTS